MPAAWVSAGIGAIGLINSLNSSNNTGGSGANMYVPTGLNSADQGWQQNQAINQGQLGGYGGLAANADPALYQSFLQSQGINYNPYLQASNQAGQQYGQLAGQAGAAGGLSMQQSLQGFGQQQNLQGMGNQLWQTAADPQNALYQQQLQQTTDQANAVNSMYGLGSSGAGAGLTSQAQNNFNLGWENQQLQRQLMGAQGVAGLNQSGIQAGNQGSANLQAGMGYYGMQPGYTQQAAQVPLNAQQYVAGMPAQNAQQYASGLAGVMSPYMQMQNQAIPYMNYGSGAGANAYANTLKGQQLQMQQLQAAGQTLGNVNWGQLSNAFSSNGYANNGTGQGGASSFSSPSYDWTYGQSTGGP